MSYTYKEKTLSAKNTGDRVKQVEDFLTAHYEIKINVFDPSKSFIVAKDKTLYEQDPTETLISLHMEREGIRGCDSILKKIIKSGYHITSFNPITDYLQSLEGIWKGESHIDKLCKYVIAREFDDQPEGFYQERFKRILKKWMAASIACSLGIRQNDAMIGFVHADEGIGKTFLIEFLTPKPLKPYYIKSDKDERFFNITTAFTRNFLVNFDEFIGITKTSAETVKKVLSSTDLAMSSTFTQSIPRIGNGVFTSNKTNELGGFLTPQMGYRRYAVIELDKIGHGYSKDVDVDQLWAEAFVLFKNADFAYEWNMEDFEEFRTYNARYLVETQAYKLIKEYYRVPEEGEESVHKQPIEILQDLRRARKLTSAMNNVSDVTIGMALRALGFERNMKKVNKISPRYGYQVIQLFE